MPDNLLSHEYGLSNARLQECNASPSDVMNGKTFYSGDKTKKTGTFSFTGNAMPSDVRSGKTFYAGDKNLKTGTLIPPTGNYSCTCNYSAPNRCTYLTFTFKDSGNYTVKVTYSTGWICYLVVNNNGNRVLETVNTGVNGNQSWTFNAYNGYTFALELHTDNEATSNRFVNTQTEVIRNY